MTRFAFYCLLVLLAVSPASAQTIQPATPEDVAIAFYKVAGLKPGFTAWAEDTPRFHETPFARREKVLAEEAERLARAYDAYSPAVNTLNLVTKADVEIEATPDPDNSLKVHNILRWRFTEDSGNFFPYEYRDMLFALVPQKMETFQEAAITPAQAKHIREKLGKGRNVPVIIQLRALQADAKKPVLLKGHETWALAAGVAGVTLWDKSGTMVWEKTAGWYTSPRTESLNQLKVQEQAKY